VTGIGRLLAVLHARRHDVRQHRIAMLMLFTGALMIAGVFTFLPGRLIHSAAYGSVSCLRVSRAQQQGATGPL